MINNLLIFGISFSFFKFFFKYIIRRIYLVIEIVYLAMFILCCINDNKNVLFIFKFLSIILLKF